MSDIFLFLFCSYSVTLCIYLYFSSSKKKKVAKMGYCWDMGDAGCGMRDALLARQQLIIFIKVLFVIFFRKGMICK